MPTTGHVFSAHAHKLPGRHRQMYMYAYIAVLGPAIFKTTNAAIAIYDAVQMPSVCKVCALLSSNCSSYLWPHCTTNPTSREAIPVPVQALLVCVNLVKLSHCYL